MEKLEALVTRLEKLAPLVDRLEAVTAALEGSSGGASGSVGGGDAAVVEDGPAVRAFDDYYQEFVSPFVQAGKAIGGPLEPVVAAFDRAISQLRNVIRMGEQCKEPERVDPASLQALPAIAALAKAIGEVGQLTSAFNRDFDNHFKLLGECVNGLGWVVVPKTPGEVAKDAGESADFYASRILMQNKNTPGGEGHVKFAMAYKKVFPEMYAYIRKFHTTGLSFNKRSSRDAATFSADGESAAPAASTTTTTSSSTPAPAAPAPAAAASSSSSSSSSSASSSSSSSAPSQGDMLAELAKAATLEGMKKVTADMKAKNQPNRSAVVPAASGSGARAPAAAAAGPKKITGERTLKLEGNKWNLLHISGEKDIVIDNAEIKHAVYLFNVHDSVIQIKSKVNSITLDNCTKTGILFENAVSTCEIVNSKSLEIQVTGSVPAIAIDSTAGVQLYVSETSKNVNIYTSKSSDVNVLVPGEEDHLELNIPYQFTTRIVNGKLVTEPVTHV